MLYSYSMTYLLLVPAYTAPNKFLLILTMCYLTLLLLTHTHAVHNFYWLLLCANFAILDTSNIMQKMQHVLHGIFKQMLQLLNFYISVISLPGLG